MKARERQLRDSLEEWCDYVQEIHGRVSRDSCIEGYNKAIFAITGFISSYASHSNGSHSPY